MGKARKKPVEIEYVQWLNRKLVMPDDHWFLKAEESGKIELAGDTLLIHTLEGVMAASPGDFIVKGVEGEIYPVKPGIFWKTYDILDGEVREIDVKSPIGWGEHLGPESDKHQDE